MQSRHSMVFKHSFGFKPGLVLGAGMGAGHAAPDPGEFSSLPCHVQSEVTRPRAETADTHLNFDSLKSEGETRLRGED